jgi:hypothetical protein
MRVSLMRASLPRLRCARQQLRSSGVDARFRVSSVAAALLFAVTTPSFAQTNTDEETCKPVTVETRRIGGRLVERVHGEPTTVEFNAGMRIDADGALRSYHPDDASGLDQLEHAGAPGNWWGIVTLDGEPIVQGEDDPAPGFYVSQTSLADPTRNPDDPQRYVDALVVPYLALQPVFVREFGCRLGDFAWATRTDVGGAVHESAAIFADVAAPHLPVGEASIALAERLGIPSSPRRGGTYRDSVRYVLFCGSGNGLPRPLTEIDAEGARLAAARRTRDTAACPRR